MVVRDGPDREWGENALGPEVPSHYPQTPGMTAPHLGHFPSCR